MLLLENEKVNTQAGIIKQFDNIFVETNRIQLTTTFSNLVYQIKEYAPSRGFAKAYNNSAAQFLQVIKEIRKVELQNRKNENT